jgi:hypothetical protein
MEYWCNPDYIKTAFTIQMILQNGLIGYYGREAWNKVRHKTSQVPPRSEVVRAGTARSGSAVRVRMYFSRRRPARLGALILSCGQRVSSGAGC